MVLLFAVVVVELIIILLLVYALMDRALEVRLLFTEAEIDGIKFKGAWNEMDIRIGQQVTATVSPIDHKGHAARVEEDSIEWSSSDESVATVEQDASNPLKALILAVGEGAVQVQIVADADMGDGVNQITGIGTIGVLPNDAVGFTNLAFSDITEQPDTLSPANETPQPDDEVDTGGQGSGTNEDK